MSLRGQFARFFSFLPFVFGGRYSLLWLWLVLLSRAILRSAEQISAPPEIVERAVEANTTEDERKAADAAWELVKDVDLTRKGWYGRLRAEWLAMREAKQAADNQAASHTSLWSGELRILGEFCSRRIHLLKKSIPRTVVLPFVWAVWSLAFALFILLAGFSATIVRLFVFLLPSSSQEVVAGFLVASTAASLPLAVLALFVAAVSVVRGIVGLFRWLKALGSG